MTHYDPRPQLAPQSFTWGRVISDLKLAGVPALIACHCDPIGYDASVPHLQLELPHAMAALERSPSMLRLQESLKDFFGEGLHVEIVMGPAKNSLANVAAGKRIAGQLVALDAVMKDTQVHELLRDFGAKVLVESVELTKPSLPSYKPI